MGWGHVISAGGADIGIFGRSLHDSVKPPVLLTPNRVYRYTEGGGLSMLMFQTIALVILVAAVLLALLGLIADMTS